MELLSGRLLVHDVNTDSRFEYAPTAGQVDTARPCRSCTINGRAPTFELTLKAEDKDRGLASAFGVRTHTTWPAHTMLGRFVLAGGDEKIYTSTAEQLDALSSIMKWENEPRAAVVAGATTMAQLAWMAIPIDKARSNACRTGSDNDTVMIRCNAVRGDGSV